MTVKSYSTEKKSDLIVSLLNLLVTLPVVPLVQWVDSKDSDFQWPSQHT